MRYYEKVKRREKIKDIAGFVFWAFGFVFMMFFIIWVLPVMLGY